MPDYLTWGHWTEGGLGGVHFGAALFCLVLGPYILLRRKGDKQHRVLGSLWAFAMLCVNISALAMYDISGRPTLFHFFALMSLAALIPGYWMIWRFKSTRDLKHLNAHQMYMVWAYFGLAAAGFWQVGLRIFLSVIGFHAYGLGLVLFGIMTFAAAIVLNVYMTRVLRTKPNSSSAKA